MNIQKTHNATCSVCKKSGHTYFIQISKDDYSILNLCSKHVISHIRKQKLKKLNEI